MRLIDTIIHLRHALLERYVSHEEIEQTRIVLPKDAFFKLIAALAQETSLSVFSMEEGDRFPLAFRIAGFQFEIEGLKSYGGRETLDLPDSRPRPQA